MSVAILLKRFIDSSKGTIRISIDWVDTYWTCRFFNSGDKQIGFGSASLIETAVELCIGNYEYLKMPDPRQETMFDAKI